MPNPNPTRYGWHPENLVRTEKRTGDRIVHGRTSYTVMDDGSWLSADGLHSRPLDAHDYTMPRTELAPRILLLLVMPVSVVMLGAWAAFRLGWL